MNERLKEIRPWVKKRKKKKWGGRRGIERKRFSSSFFPCEEEEKSGVGREKIPLILDAAVAAAAAEKASVLAVSRPRTRGSVFSSSSLEVQHIRLMSNHPSDGGTDRQTISHSVCLFLPLISTLMLDPTAAFP